MKVYKFKKNKGQIAYDFLIAMLLIIITFSIIGNIVINTANEFKRSEIVSSADAILNIFENTAIVAYNEDIVLDSSFDRIYGKNYDIYYANKVIHITGKTNITFYKNGTKIMTKNAVSSGLDMGNSLKVVVDDFYVSKELNVEMA
ncbi:hypothetical protein [Methanococcus voltae]|uniref:Flagellin n=1 Tax=Methanococcus voltae (strain ATCC BAA-1334 / A3) TaxID=456320 RepID=D7DUR2_METV3|nr:hypothetical protein [Methanococcus voltae]MCS3900674.1 hypothetical protein [Methanococcus voltae]